MLAKKSIVFIVLLLSLISAQGQSVYTNYTDFKNAIVAAQPGDEIVLKDGTYSGVASITLTERKGTAAQPIIIRAESIGGVTLNNAYFDFRKCEYVIFQGFKINTIDKSTIFKMQACNHVRITQNVIDGSGEMQASAAWISIQGLWDDNVTISHHNQIDHNRFQNKSSLGNIIKVDGTNETQVSQYDVIEYNHFKNHGPRAENEKEAIRIGWSAMSESDGFCTVRHNLFEECNGDPEIISVKCNKNSITGNTFRRCQGTLSLRHGNASLVEGNFFLGEGAEGTGGVRIYGSDHKIINNHFEGLTGTLWDAPVTLTEGDAEEGSTGLTKHFRIERAIIAHNTLVNNRYGIEIGYDNQGKYSKPPRDVVMAYNIVSGTENYLVKYINAPTSMQWVGNVFYPEGTAVLGVDASGQALSFSGDQIAVQNPFLEMNATLGYVKATASTPSLSTDNALIGDVASDIDGQLRSLPTNYGADHFSAAAVANKPLNANDVGPSTGDYLFVSTNSINTAVAGGSYQVTVSSSGSWSVADDADWVQLDKASGSGDGSVGITINENTSGLNRSATVTLTSVGGSSPITAVIQVSQLGVDPPMLSVSPTSFQVDAQMQTVSLAVTANTNWSIVETVDWLSFSVLAGTGNDDVTITVNANPALTQRQASFVVKDESGALVHTLEFVQAGVVGDEVKLTVASASASHEQVGNEAVNLIDGSTDNRWSGDGLGTYALLDLGTVREVSFLKVGIYKGDVRTSTFDILTSVDGVSYNEALMNVTTELTTEPLTLFDFDNRAARYVKFVGYGNSAGSTWNSYTEMEVWGYLESTSVGELDGVPLLLTPNPCGGSFRIKCDEPVEVEINSLTGKVVYKSSVQVNQEVQTGLESGLYLVRIQRGSQIVTQKLLVK